MKAKDRFDSAMARCDKLIELYRKEKNEDVLRMVVVLCVSALDAYATNRCMDELVPFVRNGCDENRAAEFLKSIGFTLGDAVKVFKAGSVRPLRKVRTIVEKIHEKESRQSFKKIDDIFKVYGLTELSNNALKKMRCKTARKKIELMIERRHKIVHEAEDNKILESQVCGWFKCLKKFVEAMDSIVGNKFKRNGRDGE